MSKFENILIDRADGWKYSNTFGTNGSDFHARVLVNDDGTIAEESFSKQYREQQQKGKKENRKKEKKQQNNGQNNESFLAKILKAPFRILWWLIKKFFKALPYILTFGILHSDDKK